MDNTPVDAMKPCPLCGGEADPCHEGMGYVSVRCKKCGLVMPAKYTWDAAYAAWNTRTTSLAALEEPTPEMVEAGVECVRHFDLEPQLAECIWKAMHKAAHLRKA